MPSLRESAAPCTLRSRSALPLLLTRSRASLARRGRGRTCCSAPSADCASVGQWEISRIVRVGPALEPGRGQVRHSARRDPAHQLLRQAFLPGEPGAGYTLHDGETNTFNLIATPGYDRVFFYRSDLQNIFVPARRSPLATDASAVPDREARQFVTRPRTHDLSGRSGMDFRLRRAHRPGDRAARGDGRHDGYEVRAALAAPLLRAKGSLVASAGLTWKSPELVRYYYGVQAVRTGLGAQSVRQAALRSPLSDRWTLNAFAHYEHLASAIANSPDRLRRPCHDRFAGVVFKIH